VTRSDSLNEGKVQSNAGCVGWLLAGRGVFFDLVFMLLWSPYAACFLFFGRRQLSLAEIPSEK